MLLEDRVGQPTTEAEAERLALELYGLHVAAKALPGEYDDNFHLKVKSGAGERPGAAAATPSSSDKSSTGLDSSRERTRTWRRSISPRERRQMRMSTDFDAVAEVADEASN